MPAALHQNFALASGSQTSAALVSGVPVSRWPGPIATFYLLLLASHYLLREPELEPEPPLCLLSPLLLLLLVLLPCCLLSLDVAMMISLIDGIKNNANHANLPPRMAREPSS